MDPQAASWIQTAGVGGFALLVLYILRELRPILKELAAELFEVRITFAAMLERDRIRDVRRRRESSAPPMQSARPRTAPFGVPVAKVPVGEFEDESTDIKQLIEIQREAAESRGRRGPRPGTHHDRDK